MTYNWKPLFLLSFIFTLTTGQTLLAQPANSPPRGGGGDRDELRKQLLERFDKNNDGKISRDEMTDNFTYPLRPELPLGHPGFGIPMPDNPQRKE